MDLLAGSLLPLISCMMSCINNEFLCGKSCASFHETKKLMPTSVADAIQSMRIRLRFAVARVHFVGDNKTRAAKPVFDAEDVPWVDGMTVYQFQVT